MSTLPSSDGFGLDKTARNAALATAKAKANQPAALNPDFPFPVAPFPFAALLQPQQLTPLPPLPTK